ncbi:hypothetical protein FQN52_009661 [Onygenales sp. PD_12]|nr:hypothetical protein FQN52_009661 [Onygenales sp. PD_12]
MGTPEALSQLVIVMQQQHQTADSAPAVAAGQQCSESAQQAKNALLEHTRQIKLFGCGGRRAGAR